MAVCQGSDAEVSSSATTTRTPAFVTNTPTTTILRSGATVCIQRADPVLVILIAERAIVIDAAAAYFVGAVRFLYKGSR